MPVHELDPLQFIYARKIGRGQTLFRLSWKIRFSSFGCSASAIISQRVNCCTEDSSEPLFHGKEVFMLLDGKRSTLLCCSPP